jgi:hypothetical protein
VTRDGRNETDKRNKKRRRSKSVVNDARKDGVKMVTVSGDGIEQDARDAELQ